MTRQSTDPEAPVRPLLSGFFRVIPLGDDGVQVRSSGRVIALSGPGMAQDAARILGALDGTSTAAELAERLGLDLTLVDGLVGRLTASGVIEDGAAPSPPPAASLVGGHALELGADAPAVSAGLARARIAIVGLGPAGRWAARHLAAAGIGEMVVIDAGVLSDFDDAIVAPVGPAAAPGRGRTRADVVSEECAAMSTAATKVQALTAASGDLESARALLADVDLVVVEADPTGEPVLTFNTACLRWGGRLLPYSVTSLEAVIGPLVEAGGSPCYLCAENRRLSHLRHHDAHLAYRQALGDGSIGAPQAAVLAGHAGIAGGLLSLEILRLVAALGSPSTTGAVLVTDFKTLETGREIVVAVPGCTACGNASAL